ncbi:MAG: hypothetical protein ACK5C0_02190 [Candidatus Kapaibacterium sp.]|jgi:hypothetical protein
MKFSIVLKKRLQNYESKEKVTVNMIFCSDDSVTIRIVANEAK